MACLRNSRKTSIAIEEFSFTTWDGTKLWSRLEGKEGQVRVHMSLLDIQVERSGMQIG